MYTTYLMHLTYTMHTKYTIYMQYTISELRTNTRKILNEVDAGERVSIKRYDKIYNLLPSDLRIVKKSGIQVVTLDKPSELKKPTVAPIIKTQAQAVTAANSIVKDSTMKFCKNNHPIPDGRTKCMGKNCTYAK